MDLGTFEGSGAGGFSAAGVVERDVFGNGGRVTVGAGLGLGFSEGTVGGKARAQVTW